MIVKSVRNRSNRKKTEADSKERVTRQQYGEGGGESEWVKFQSTTVATNRQFSGIEK